MKISVIVPIYNGKLFIERCCIRLAAQTLKDLEFILVDDGSSDGSAEICDKMGKNYNNCKVIHQNNKGVSAARNRGIELATGEYIGFVDVDDDFEKDMFEYLYMNAVHNDLDVLAMEQAGTEGSICIFSEQTDWMRAFFESEIGMSVCKKIVKKEIISNQLFPEGKRIHEDLVGTYNMLIASRRVGSIVTNKYHYIQREGSSSRVAVFTDKYLDAVKIANWMHEDALRRFPTLGYSIEGRKARTYLRITKIYYLRKAPKEYRKEILEMREYLKGLKMVDLRRYFKFNDLIRYSLYIYGQPLFLFMLKTVDKK